MQNLNDISKLTRWLSHIARDYRRQIILNLTIGIAHVVIGLTIVYITKRCIDSFSWLNATLLVLLLFTDIGLAYAVKWIRAILSIRSRNRLQQSYLHQLLNADWQTLHSHHSGALINSLGADVSTVSGFLSDQFPQLITTILQFIGAFIFLAYLNWRIALILALFTPIVVGACKLYMHRMRQYSHDVRDQEATIQSFLQEILQQSLLIKALDRISMVDNHLQNGHNHLESLVRRNTRYTTNAGTIINITFTIGYLIAFFWGVYSLNTGAITFGALVAFIQLVGQLQSPVRTLIGYVSVFTTTFTAADRLMSLPTATAPTGIMHGDVPLPTPAATLSPAEFGGVTINHLTFAYDGTSTPIFSDWSATIPAGKMTAIVGHTGAGKTTLVQPLLGLLHPQSGEITFSPIAVTHDGTTLHSPAEFGGAFTYVPQGNTLFSGSIRDNLRYGNPAATDAEMLHALCLAHVDFLDTLDHRSTISSPEGRSGGVLESERVILGERGAGLSEGQAQRVGIARALLKPADIILLDEAFSALDTDTATLILSDIRAAFPTRTIIYITHREALLTLADHIIRL